MVSKSSAALTVAMCISCQKNLPPLPRELQTARDDPVLIALASGLFLLAVASFCAPSPLGRWLVYQAVFSPPFYPAAGMFYGYAPNSLLAYLTAAVADLYLVMLLVFAAVRSDAKEDRKDAPAYMLLIFPSRRGSLVVLPLITGGLVLSFASIYSEFPDLAAEAKEWTDAIYISLVTMVSPGNSMLSPANLSEQLIVIWQLASSMLLLFVAFPLLLARISSFGPANHKSCETPPPV